MKLVEGQLQFLQFVSDFSGISNSMASEGLRDFVASVERTDAVFQDLVPRWVDVTPAVDQEGHLSGKWADPGDETGRIVTGKG